MFYTSLLHAAASSPRVEQGIMGHWDWTAPTLLMYFQFRSGMGFSHNSLPDCRLASASQARARWVSTVLVSERIKKVVLPFKTGGRAAHRVYRASPKSVPRP